MEAPILGAPSFWLEARIPCSSASNPETFRSNPGLPSAIGGPSSETPCFASPPRSGARSFRVTGSPPPLEPSGIGGSQRYTPAAHQTNAADAGPSQMPVGEHEHVISWKILDARANVLEVREDCAFGCSKSVQGGQDAGARRGGARPGAAEGSPGSAAHSLVVRIVFENQHLLSALAAESSSAGAREDTEPALVGAMSAPGQPKPFTLFVVSDRGDIFSFSMDTKGPGVDLLARTKPQTPVKQAPGKHTTQTQGLPEGSTWVLPDANFHSPAVKRLDPALAVRLGMLTCAGAGEAAVCLGGTAGVVVWVPLTSAPRFGPLSPGAGGGAAAGFAPTVELRDSAAPAARGLLGGWGRGGGQSETGALPVLALRPVVLSNKKALLLAARADGTLQLWDPAKKLKLGQTRVDPSGMQQPDPGAGGSGTLAHQVRLIGAATEEGETTLLASWQAWPAGGDSSSAPAIAEQSPQQTPVPRAPSPPQALTLLSLFRIDLGDGLEAAQSTALGLAPVWHTTELPAGTLLSLTTGTSNSEAWALIQRSGAAVPGAGPQRPGETAVPAEPLEAAAGMPAAYRVRAKARAAAGRDGGPSAEGEVEKCVLVEDSLLAASGVPLGPLASLCSSLILEDVVPGAKEGALRQALAGALLSPRVLVGSALEEVVESSRRASLSQPGSFQPGPLRPLAELSFGALRRELAAAVHHLEKQMSARSREQGHGFPQAGLPPGPLRTIQAWQALVRAYLAALCRSNAPCCLLHSTSDPGAGATYVVRHHSLSVVRSKDQAEVLLGQADPEASSISHAPTLGLPNGLTTSQSIVWGGSLGSIHVRLLQQCTSLIRQRLGPIVLGVLPHELLAHPEAARGVFRALAGFLELGETQPVGYAAGESSFSRGVAAGHAKAKQLRASHRVFSTEFEALLRALGEAREGEGDGQTGWGPVLASIQEILDSDLESPRHIAANGGVPYTPAPPLPASLLAPALAAVSESRLELLLCLTTLLHFLAARRTPVLGLSSSQALLLTGSLIPSATARIRRALALHHLAHTFRTPTPEDGDAASAFAEDLVGLSLSEGNPGAWAGPGWSPMGWDSKAGTGFQMPGGGAQQGTRFGVSEAQGLKGLKSVVRRPPWSWAAPDRTLLCLVLSTPPLPARQSPLHHSCTTALSPGAFLAAAAQCLDRALAQPTSGPGTPAGHPSAGGEGGEGRQSREETPTDGEEVPGAPGVGVVALPQGAVGSLQTLGLRLGLKLLERSQFPSMKIILELLGDGSVDPAPALSAGQPPASSPAARAARSFLLGFATLACAAQPDEATALVPLSPPQGPADIGQQAARHFFSAANGVGLKAANAQPGHGSSAAEAAASSVLGITSFLEGSFLAGSTSQADMFTAPPYSVDDGDEETGADMDTGAEGVGSLPQTWEASRKVRYYEAVMRLLERYGQSQLAVLFASAALELIDQTCKPSSSREGVAVVPGYTGEVVRTAGRLWTVLFKAHLASGRFREAFCAIASNPEPIDRQICLRRFVMRLFELWSEKGHIHKGSLPPFSPQGPPGSDPGSGGPEVGPTAALLGLELPLASIGLEREVVSELEWRCQNSGVAAEPCPHKALYAFHVARCNWSESASVMYSFAQRLRHALAQHGLRPPAASQQTAPGGVPVPAGGIVSAPGRRYRHGGLTGAGPGVPAADRVRQEALRVKEEAALRARGTFLLEEYERSLALAIGSLALLPPNQAWVLHSTSPSESTDPPLVHPSTGDELALGTAGQSAEAAQAQSGGAAISSPGVPVPVPGLAEEGVGAVSPEAPEAAHMERDAGTPEQQEQRKRSRLDVGALRKGGGVGEEGGQGAGGMVIKGGVRRVVRAEDMRKELAAVTAALALHRSGRNADPVKDLSLGSLVPALIEQQQYAAALALLRAMAEPGMQTARQFLVLLFASFARSCCELQLQGGSAKAKPLLGPSALSPGKQQGAPLFAQPGAGGRDAAGEFAPSGGNVSWENLRGALEEFCCWHPALRVVVARAILSSHPLLPLPPWLVGMFTEGVPAPPSKPVLQEGVSTKGHSGLLCARDPYGLMEVYLEFGALLDACQLALVELSQWNAERRSSLPGAKLFLASYVRHATLDKILLGLKEAQKGGGTGGRVTSDDAVLDKLTSALERAMQEHLQLVVRDSEDFRELQS